MYSWVILPENGNSSKEKIGNWKTEWTNYLKFAKKKKKIAQNSSKLTEEFRLERKEWVSLKTEYGI